MHLFFSSRKGYYLLLTLFLECYIGMSFSQSNPFDEMRQIPITSPDISALSKAVEFPVTHFNGKPSISIPIYTIKTGDLELPISLSYNAGGIQVSEESSWVGLGWALNAGGMISRQIKGLDDDHNYANLSFMQIYPDGVGNNYQPSSGPRSFRLSTNGIYKPTGQIYSDQETINRLSGSIDGEPDLYVYNFGKYSGKFVWLSSDEVVDISKNNIKFSKSGVGILAVDPEGFKYEFMELEMSLTASGPTKTAYLLTKITSPNNRVATLTYKTFREYVYPTSGPGKSGDYIGIATAFEDVNFVYQMPNLSEEYVTREYIEGTYYGTLPGTTGLNRTFSSYSIRNLFLDKIIFENGSVEFTHGSREDLFGVRLDGIVVKNKADATVFNTSFDYEYFTGRPGSDSYTVSGGVGVKVPYDLSYRSKRLKLKSLTIRDEIYHFYYNEGSDGYTLPYKSSFAQDYWGYYNGADQNTTLVPDFRRYNFRQSIPPQLSNWIGANRDPVLGKAIEGSLKKIMYPTKGLVEFEYDLHEFTNGPPQTITQYQEATALNTTTGVTTAIIDIAQDSYVDVHVSLFCNQAADANPQGIGWDCSCIFPPSCSPNNIPNSMWVKIEKINISTGQATPTQWEYDFGKDIIRNNAGTFGLSNQYFTAGRYRLTANYPDNKTGEPGSKMAFIRVVVPITTSTSPNGYGGGLRVASVSRYDPVSKINSRKWYSYEEGKMMRFPSYYSWLNNIHTSSWDPPGGGTINYLYKYRTHVLHANSRIPFSFSANGSHVGYGKVKEFYAGELQGRTEYIYNIFQDNYTIVDFGDPNAVDHIAGTPSVPLIGSGFLKHVNSYDKDNQLIKKIENSPRTELPNSYWSFKQRKYTSDGIPQNLLFKDIVQVSFYPIQAARLVTANTTETVYDAGGSIETTKVFEYNNGGYLKTETSYRSDEAPVTKNFRYPTDFTATTGWIGELKNRNMISTPLETVTKVNDKLIAGSYIKYSIHDNILTPATIYQAEVLSPKSVSYISPSGTIPGDYKIRGTLSYDAAGNLIFSKPDNDIATGYLWGYENTYPIAVCNNAPPTEFYLEDFEGNGTIASNTTSAHTGKGGYSGSVNLGTKFSASTGGRTYRLSYFKMNGSKWEYFDLPYTGQTISGVLDDIRIFPIDAAMTSYTYAPLIGITSEIDPAGNTKSYMYDTNNHLFEIRDQEGYVLKAFYYNYSPTLGNINSTSYGNIAMSENFTKQCPVGEGSIVPYNVPADKYSAGSPEEANALARQEIEKMGQQNANNIGTCSTGLQINSITNGPANTFTVSFTCPPDVNYIQLFVADPVTNAPHSGTPFTVNVGMTSFTNIITKGKTWVFHMRAGGSNYPTVLISEPVTYTFP